MGELVFRQVAGNMECFVDERYCLAHRTIRKEGCV
jgi:hypothetical protein